MPTSLRPSRVLQRLRSGQVACCCKLNLADGRVAEIAALAGFDCVWLDLEHVANDLAAIESGIWAAKSQDVDVLVRTPRGSYSDLIRPLELDAAGIMVPHVMSAADARQIVRQTRFHPVGRRPLDGGNADGRYTQVSTSEYVRAANEQRFVCIQIEDPEPLEELDEIAELPGIDMLFFGPADFSQGIGAPGQFDHPAIGQARRRVAAVARAHGKFAGTVGGPGDLEALVTMGYQFVNVAADVVGLTEYFGKIVVACGAVTGPRPGTAARHSPAGGGSVYRGRGKKAR